MDVKRMIATVIVPMLEERHNAYSSESLETQKLCVCSVECIVCGRRARSYPWQMSYSQKVLLKVLLAT